MLFDVFSLERRGREGEREDVPPVGGGGQHPLAVVWSGVG